MNIFARRILPVAGACLLAFNSWAAPLQEQPAPSSKGAPDHWLEQWTLKTSDTTLILGAGSDQKLYLCKVSSPADWNWTATPSPFPLVSRVDVAGAQRALNWAFQKGTQDQVGGVRITITFTNAEPALELTSIWQARSGPGPVRHTMFIRNCASRKVTIYAQESLEMQLAGPGNEMSVCYINDDASVPDATGVYRDPLTAGYKKQLRINEEQDFIPFTMVDANGKHGVYVGWEWSIGRIAIAADAAPGSVAIKVGNGDNFKTDLDPGETFEVPSGFIGAYQGDMDDAGNSLRKYLYNYSMPAILRDDPGYPKVEWNAFAATGKGQGSWDSTETKYYPLIDQIAPLGFEEVVLDISWWQGDTTHKPHPPVGDKVDWPSGMLAARNYAHDRGMRFGLYWNCNPPMTTFDGLKHRQEDTRYLYDQFRIDFFRSDSTDGKVLQTGGYGPGTRAHYPEDAGYWQTKGYYEVLDSLSASLTNFSYENCSSGGSLKDYGLLKRCLKIQNQDRYYPLDARQSFYDASFALHPMQIAALCGSWGEWQASGSAFEFRSSSMGAAYWHPDAPDGGNGGPVWSAAQKALIKRAVNTYKIMIRPLVRNANLYHIFPRPTGKIWDGIEYFDPATRKGAVFVFRPDSPDGSHTIKLKGLEPGARYWLWCEDGSFAPMQMDGAGLMQTGLTLALPRTNTSEIVFLQDAALGRPAALPSSKAEQAEPARPITVASYYFGNYHPGDPRNTRMKGKDWSEWELVKAARPRFAGHQQPKVPLWGYADESDPRVMAQKIDAAADHGIDAFIFDWYHYDDGPFLDRPIDRGFLQATNNHRLNFAFMWANHDWLEIQPYKRGTPPKLLFPGKVTPATFDRICDHVIKDYFQHPSYWRIDGRPYFSFYELTKLMESFGSVEATRQALDRFRAKAQAAGFPGLHLNAVVWGQPILPGEQKPGDAPKLVRELGFDSVTSYVWIHHVAMPNQVTDYNFARDDYFKYWDRAANLFGVPYFPNVSMGWDPSPRAAQEDEFGNFGYPFTNTIGNNTPDNFKLALEKTKERLLTQPNGPRILTINCWNEWTEGSYLEPDTVNGFKYLEAVRAVFGPTLPLPR